MTLHTLRRIVAQLLREHGNLEMVLDPDMDPEAVQEFKIEIIEIGEFKFAFITTKTTTL